VWLTGAWADARLSTERRSETRVLVLIFGFLEAGRRRRRRRKIW